MSPWDGNPCKPKPQTTFVTLPLHLSRRTRWLSIACRLFTLFHAVVIDLRGENIMNNFHGLNEIIALDFCLLRPYISNNRLRRVGPTRKEVALTPMSPRSLEQVPSADNALDSKGDVT
jgi:hypothetical protein